MLEGDLFQRLTLERFLIDRAIAVPSGSAPNGLEGLRTSVRWNPAAA
jgi:hypothetical protein